MAKESLVKSKTKIIKCNITKDREILAIKDIPKQILSSSESGQFINLENTFNAENF